VGGAGRVRQATCRSRVVAAAANLVFVGLSTLTFLDIPGPAPVAAVEVGAAISLVMLPSVLLASVARHRALLH
jgi:hypothetical protein